MESRKYCNSIKVESLIGNYTSLTFKYREEEEECVIASIVISECEAEYLFACLQNKFNASPLPSSDRG